MQKTIWLIVVTFIAGVVSLHLSLIDILLSVFSLPLLYFIFQKFSLRKHLAKYIMLFVVYASVLFIPGFHLSYNQITTEQYSLAFSFGTKLFLVTSISWIVVGFFRRKRNKDIIYSHRRISNSTVYGFLFFSIILSLYSLSIGLGRMGGQAVKLPFHLGGVIMVVRLFLIPYAFMLIYENFILTKRKFDTLFFVLFLIWCMIEVFARLSKGALVISLLPVTIIHWLYFRPTIKKMLPYLLPVLFLFFFLYPIVQNMRYVDSKSSFIESFFEAENESKTPNEKGNVFITALNRTFMTTNQYINDYYVYSDKELFNFSQAPAIIAIGGTGRYQTVVIDGYDESAIHSSGTTGIMDPLLFGGYGFCYVMMFLLMWMASAIDNNYYKKMHSVYVILLLLFLTFIRDRNISYPFAENGLPYLLAYVVAIYIAIRYNFRSKHISIGPKK